MPERAKSKKAEKTGGKKIKKAFTNLHDKLMMHFI
jgi:hypothetical protein